MNPRQERHIHLMAMVVVASAAAGLIYSVIQGNLTPVGIASAMAHGVAISLILSIFEMVSAETGIVRDWIGGLPFTSSLLLRSAVYAAVILLVEVAFNFIDHGEFGPENTRDFWNAAVFAAIAAVAINFVVEVGNLLGARTFSNFITGRYHAPVEESRFVLFVDIVGSTGLAERLGGIGIHRFLDRTFRALTEPVVDYRGEVLDYVGDELIVTWPERTGAVDSRPLRCFLAMRAALDEAAPRFEREFGAAPRVRGSLHFGPIIIGEIGDIKRAIVFNGDVMNTAARLEQLSREADGGFLASAAAIARLGETSTAVLRARGRVPIRGRVDGMDVYGLAVGASD
ncbi:MAG: adenylate/guanylate cyclase domain-containing protein [Rhizobiales bacterium]|nr:adenylate/guanylate cyclase domain-containing protein [Hyphomicrobiales bacterium]